MPKIPRIMTVLAVLLASLVAGVPASAVAPAPSGVGAGTPSTDPAAAESKKLQELFDGYFEEYLALNPLLATSIGDPRYNDRFEVSISPDWRARNERLQRGYLERIKGIEPGRLGAKDRISYQMFRSARETDIEGLRFPGHLIPLNQFYSVPSTFVQLGSGSGQQPFKTVEDYDAFLKRVDGLVAWSDQAIVNMREGVANGVVQPRPVMEKVLSQLDAIILAKAEDSPFYGPIAKFPDTVPVAERERLTVAYKAAIDGKVMPAYRRVRDYVREDYLPKTRTSVAWTALPDGKAWYAYLVKQHTTTDMTPEQIHQVGLDEVARILGEMDGVRRKVGFEGDLQAFFNHLESDPQFYFTQSAELLQGYRDIKVRIDAALPNLFSLLPKADYQVRAVEPYRAQSAAGANYQRASADGSRPGIFYVNTFNLKAQPRFGMETLSLHEASPGHHFQGSIAQELTGLPKFRRFGGGYTAYVEGWALYAEYLGKELGLFTDPYQWFGRLNDEQLRAMRLVVDTGLHSLGWSREQAIKYMLENSTLAESDVVSEVERYIAWPGQALGYKIGDLRLQALRRNAENELRAKFDVRDFHREVLNDGAVPLDVLEAKIARWVTARE